MMSTVVCAGVDCDLVSRFGKGVEVFLVAQS